MSFRVNPLWWPVLGVASPVLVPMLLKRNRKYRENVTHVKERNRHRLEQAAPMDLPELEFLEITVLSEYLAEEGFRSESGVSYLVKSNLGSVLFDVGFGPQFGVLGHNAQKVGFTLDQTDALVISHLHLDHMGGMEASRANCVAVPEELGRPGGMTCFLPDQADAEGFTTEIVDAPRVLTGGIGSTGPLGRSLFFFGITEEQTLVARLKDKGLVVITGCGHPTIELILDMAHRLCDEPVYAVCGGLHYPLKTGRHAKAGIQLQMIFGSDKPAWKRLKDKDLTATIAAINENKPYKVLLSAHDSDDYSLMRFKKELAAETEVLKAGATYRM